jgi:voltage-gated potassium channel
MSFEYSGRSADEELSQLRRRLTTAALFLFGLLCTGVLGYKIIVPGTSWLDAFYMTVITLTTVGYGEVINVEGSTGGRLFTMILLVVGVGGAAYFVSTATAFVVEGQLGHVFWRHRMKKEIAQLTGHYIVCGSDEAAVYATQELRSVRREVVAICEDPARVEQLRRDLVDVPLLIGDPGSDDVLLEAGIKRAAGLIASTEQTKDNLIITLTARQLNSRLRLITRVADVSAEQKARNAGADAVVCPNYAGGLRLASELVRPTVVSFLDIMLRDRDKNLRVDEVALVQNCVAIGKCIDELALRDVSNALLLACRMKDGRWIYNPPGTLEMAPGMTLIMMGSPDDLAAVRACVAAADAAAPELTPMT